MQQVANDTGVLISQAVINPWNEGANALEAYRKEFQALRDEVQKYADENAANQKESAEKGSKESVPEDMKAAKKKQLAEDIQWLIDHYDKNAKIGASSDWIKKLKETTKDMNVAFGVKVGGIDSNPIWGAGTASNLRKVAEYMGLTGSITSKKGKDAAGTAYNGPESISKSFLKKWKKYITSHAKGVRNLKKDEIAWTQELGREAILSPTRNAILTPLKAGDSVLTKAQTDTLFRLAKNPVTYLKQLQDFDHIKLASVNGGIVMNIDNVMTVQGDVNDSNAKEISEIAQKAITKAFNEFGSRIKK